MVFLHISKRDNLNTKGSFMEDFKCCDCKIVKEIKDFYKGQKRCKECTKIRNRKFKEKNPEYHKVGGPGYTYDKIDRKAHNKQRYQKYKGRYQKYNDEFRQTPRGSLYQVLEAIRGRAKKKGYELDFDLEHLVSLFEQQSGKCVATGIPFDLSDTSRSKRFRPFSVSIDRIDSNGIYCKQNIRLVCVAFNLALNSFGEEVFEKIAKGYLES